MKRLVLCCDGTWNTADQAAPTNVRKFQLEVAPTARDGMEQRAFYHHGVGAGLIGHWTGGAFGAGLSQIVRDTYRTLISAYVPGDDLYFVGFSRGAYTARSTVGLVRNSGILRPEHADRIDEAYALYRRRDPKSAPDAAEAARFRERWSWRDRTPIRFIGVWDTVGALGIPFSGVPLLNLINKPWQFHDTKLSSTVVSAAQALSVDEKRSPFEPAVWRPPDDGDVTRRQVWFAGDHSDVGGGHPEHALSDVTLRWMAARATACGLAFADDSPLSPDATTTVSPRIGSVDADPFGPAHDSSTGPFRLLTPSPRTIGAVDPVAEAAASTARERFESQAHGYRPGNLRAYFTRADHRIEPIESDAPV